MADMTLEEALAAATVDDGTETAYCTVDDDTRLVTIPDKYKKLGVESDEKAKRVWFRFPKLVGNNGVDLSAIGVRINFRNANGDGDIYMVKDVTIDGDYVTFSWELTRKVTAYKGHVSFVVCAVKSATDGTIKNEWNTTLNKECEVLEGLEVTEQIVQENPDIIEYILANLGGSVSSEQIAQAVEEYMTTHPFTETDPTVPDWAKQPEKPSYTADEVGALPNTTTTLPNPNALTFTGAVTGSYDGSSPIEINIPEGGGTGVTVDTTLSVAGQAADAKATGDAISSLSEDIANKTGTGLSTEAIDKLEEVGNYLAYTTADGGSKWTELISILRNGSSGGGSGETVPATGISLDKTTLSFTDSATQTLVATVEPSDTTDKVVWTSNAESVAKVTNGVVKPLSNGSATITATCGSVSATCFVTVDIAEEEQVTLTSISATYTGGDVAVGTSLDDLTGITVTAHYSDGSTVNVTGYTLSGTIAEGSNTITVSYGGKTTTFTVIGTASAGETIVYNVFTGEYINSGYSGDNYTNYGANYNIYQEEIDVTDASTLYYRFGRNNKVTGATQSGLKLGVYSSDGSVLGVLDLSDSSTVTEVDGKYDINGLETLDDGTVIYGIYVASVSLSSFENKSYVKFAVLRSSKFVPRWNGNAQSTSALSLEV